MAPPDLGRGEQQVGPFRQFSQVRQVLQARHTPASESPVSHQSPPWIRSTHGGAVGSHATNPLSIQVQDRSWTWGRPAFALAIEWGFHAILGGVLPGAPLVAVIAAENDDFAGIERTLPTLKFLDVGHCDLG